MLCAVLVREPLWLEARMDDQALLEGIVVFSDEDGPRNEKGKASFLHDHDCKQHDTHSTQHTVLLLLLSCL